MEHQDKTQLADAYEILRKRNPPKGFGLISEETQMLVDLLDGDISGLVQQHLAGADVEAQFREWQERAESAGLQLEKCVEKLAEVQEHTALILRLGAMLEQRLAEK